MNTASTGSASAGCAAPPLHPWLQPVAPLGRGAGTPQPNTPCPSERAWRGGAWPWHRPIVPASPVLCGDGGQAAGGTRPPAAPAPQKTAPPLILSPQFRDSSERIRRSGESRCRAYLPRRRTSANTSAGSADVIRLIPAVISRRVVRAERGTEAHGHASVALARAERGFGEPGVPAPATPGAADTGRVLWVASDLADPLVRGTSVAADWRGLGVLRTLGAAGGGLGRNRRRPLTFEGFSQILSSASCHPASAREGPRRSCPKAKCPHPGRGERRTDLDQPVPVRRSAFRTRSCSWRVFRPSIAAAVPTRPRLA